MPFDARVGEVALVVILTALIAFAPTLGTLGGAIGATFERKKL